ncbi:MAG TPA: hypothetical protein VGE09_03375 [Pseudoxanthomonas sp.]
MGVIAGGGGARAVIVRERVPVRTVEQKTDVLAVPDRPAPGIAVDADTQRTVEVSSPGVQGPKGEPGTGTSAVLSVNGMVGDVALGADDVQADPEGAAIAAASASMAAHLADPDPHGQYIAAGDILDGGNF